MTPVSRDTAIEAGGEPLRTTLDLLAVLRDSYPEEASKRVILEAARNIAAIRAVELHAAHRSEHGA